RAIVLSEGARRNGNQPFGALLVGADGEIIAEAENAMLSARDLTAHAEMNALRMASRRAWPVQLAGATMYASGEPCPMCAGAMLQHGLRRIVFGIRWHAIRQYPPPAPPGTVLPTATRRAILHLAPQPV